ncbi:MAG: ChbG/HpnK family deacetylase [Candidatus Lokiarchaeia archaeon]
MRDTKQKILFLNPPLTPAQRYGLLSQAGAVEPPLGLAYLAAVTRNMGYKTTIVDAETLNLNVEDCLKLILNEKPDFLGITITTPLLPNVSKVAFMVKEKMPTVKIIVGGCHFSSLPAETMHENPSFDIGVIGEGERTIEELLKTLSDGGKLSSVRGIVFRDNGQLIITSGRERIKNLDELPMPAFDLLPELKRYYRTTTQSIKYLPTTSLVTSRGCTGHCTFCDKRTFGNEIRAHSAEYVADMMERLSKDFDIRGIIFEEDNFMLSEKRLSNLTRLIKKRKIKLALSVLSRIDTITEKKLRIVKSGGCWQVLYGIESGSQKILDFYKKGITTEQIKEAVYTTKKCGIYVKGLFIWGNPLETKETLQETRALIMNMPLDDISLTFFTPYPGAEIWESIDNYGTCIKDWDRLTCFDIVFIPDGMTEKEICDSQAETLKEFYKQPRVLWSYLGRLRSFSQIRELYRSWRALSIYVDTNKETKGLIVNADDFGLCEGINRGTVKALQEGIVTSVSIMPCGRAFKSAVDIVKQHPAQQRVALKVGVHLSLIATSPILPRNKIPSLLDKKGCFIESLPVFLIRYFCSRIKKKQIRKELRAQIEKVKETGLEITHLDSHRNIHLLPGIFKIVLTLAEGYQIPFIRLPSAPLDFRYLSTKAKLTRKLCQIVLNILCALYKPVMKRRGICFADYSLGFLESGHLTSDNLKNIMLSLKKGQYELVCHPGEEDDGMKRLIGHWGYQWQQELEALTSSSIKEYISHNRIELRGFNGS